MFRWWRRVGVVAGLCSVWLLRSLTLLAAQPGGSCSLVGPAQVGSQLARLEVHTGSAYRKGERVHVTLLLRAGSRAVSVPDYFGPFQATCSYGFAAALLTMKGKLADLSQPGCAYAGSAPLVSFVALRPGETRTWSTELGTKLVGRGAYCVYAEYLISESLLGTASGLPTDKTLVAAGRITAVPVRIIVR